MKPNQKFREILCRVELPGWRFRVAYFPGGHHCFLQTVREQDGCHPEYGAYKWPLGEDADTAEILETCLKAVVEELEGEVRENLFYRGTAVFAVDVLEKVVAAVDAEAAPVVSAEANGANPPDADKPDGSLRRLGGSLKSSHRGHVYTCLQYATKDITSFWVVRNDSLGLYLDGRQFAAVWELDAFWYGDVQAAQRAAVRAIEQLVARTGGKGSSARTTPPNVGYSLHREPAGGCEVSGARTDPGVNGVTPSSVVFDEASAARPFWASGDDAFLGVHRGVGLRFSYRPDGTWACTFPLSGHVLWRRTVAGRTTLPWGFPSLAEAVSTALKAVNEDWGSVRTVAARGGGVDKTDVEVLAELVGVGPQGWAESAKPG